MTQQGDRQASVRTVTGTSGTYDGDWSALFDAAGIAAGDFNGRLLAWINLKLATSYINVNDALQALATANAAFNFSSMGTFDASTSGGSTNLLLQESGSHVLLEDGVSRLGLETVAVTLAPSALWSGTAGSGFDATGVSAFPEPTPSAARAATDPVRPSLQPMVRSFETIDRQTTFGFAASFSGKLGGPQGLAYVQIDLEGSRYTAIAPSDYTLTDANGTTWPMRLHNFVFDFASTVSRHASGRVKYYVTAVANDPAADPQVMGPYYITPRTSYLTAPWDPTGLAIYDHIFKIDKTGVIPSSFTTIALAMQAAVTAGSKSPLWAICRDGSHPVASNFQVTGGPSAALEWGTFMADPTTVTTGWWVGDGTSTNGFAPRWDGMQFQGFLTKIIPTQLGVGFNVISPGSTFPSICFNGCEIYQDAGVGAASYTAWNGVSGAGALFNGLIPPLNWISSTATNVHWLEVDIHDTIYGFLGGIARNCVGHKTFKYHQNINGSYNCTLYETGGYNNPGLTPMDALSIWYSGAASVAQVQKTTANGVAGTLSLIEDGVTSPSSPSVALNRTLTQLVADINSVTGWNATLLATTPALSRNATYLWYGTLGITPPSQGVGTTASPSLPVTVSKSSGSPTVLQTIQDAHSDNQANFGTRPPPVQNRIHIDFSSWGAKAAQTNFLDRSTDYYDCYFGSSVYHDVTYLTAGLLDFSSGYGGVCSNVVEEYVTATGTGASRSFFTGTGGNPYVGDAYCKHHATYYDGVYSSGNTPTPGTAQLALVQFLGIATKADSIIPVSPIKFGGSTQGVPDADSFFLGTAADPATIFVDPIGVAPYGYRGAGTQPDLSPKTATILRMPVSLKTCGAFAFGGARQLAA